MTKQELEDKLNDLKEELNDIEDLFLFDLYLENWTYLTSHCNKFMVHSMEYPFLTVETTIQADSTFNKSEVVDLIYDLYCQYKLKRLLRD